MRDIHGDCMQICSGTIFLLLKICLRKSFPGGCLKLVTLIFRNHFQVLIDNERYYTVLGVPKLFMLKSNKLSPKIYVFKLRIKIDMLNLLIIYWCLVFVSVSVISKFNRHGVEHNTFTLMAHFHSLAFISFKKQFQALTWTIILIVLLDV